MTSEQSETLESDASIEDNSIENDFYFSHLTIETNDDDYAQLDAPEAPTLENIQFKEGISLELYEIVPPPTLQQLAAYVIAIESWHRVINLEDSNRLLYRCNFFYEEFIDDEYLLQHLPLPGLIRDIVKSCLEPVKSEMRDWLYYDNYCYNCNMFTRPPELSDLMYCLWLPDGEIDRRRTALNMLSNREMSILHRFRIISEYCLEDEIKKLSPNSIPERFRRRITFDKAPVQYYWLCYMNHDLDKLRARCSQSIEAFMISTNRLETWSAIEYFWDRLNVNEQISAASMLLKNYGNAKIQRVLFSKMNQFQKYHVLTSIPDSIMVNFYFVKLYELAFLTLVRFGNSITFEEFEYLITMLLRCCLPDNEEAMSYLVKIWNHFPDDFKTRALSSITEEVIEAHYEYYGSSVLNSIDFLSLFLSTGSVDFRRNIMFQDGVKLVLGCERSKVNRLIRSCLPDHEDIVIFQKHLLRSNEIKFKCSSFLNGTDDDHKQLADFLNQIFSNFEDKLDLIEGTLVWTESGHNRFFLCSDGMKQWAKAIEFIDKYIEASPQKIMKYKRRIIWTSVIFYAQCNHNYKDLHQFLLVISRVLDGDLLEKYKKSALRRFHRQCNWVIFDKIRVHQFLLWCLNYDYVEMRRFVKSLSIDDIFKKTWDELKRDQFFEEEQSYQAVSKKFAPIDEMLLWYFERSERVKEFKLKKVLGFQDRRPEFVRGDDSDEVFCRNVLPWFFDGDREEIKRFNELYAGDDSSNMIRVDNQ